MQNLFIASLAPADRVAIEAILTPVILAQKKSLFQVGEKISKVYFPTSAVISLVAPLSSGAMIEVAMVGRDGLVGGSAALDGKTAVSQAVIQVEGNGFVSDSKAFKSAVMGSSSMLSKVIRHEQTLFVQAQQSAACISRHEADGRLARWLLRARDLHGFDELDFTQEFLAEMIGVGRPTVSLIASRLQAAGIIQYNRGKIRILDLKALTIESCECYLTVKKHYLDLMD